MEGGGAGLVGGQVRTVLELWVDCEDERGDASTGGGDTQLGDQCEHRAVVLHAPNHWQMLLRERAGPSIGLAEVGAEDSDGHVPGVRQWPTCGES